MSKLRFCVWCVMAGLLVITLGDDVGAACGAGITFVGLTFFYM